MKRILSSLAFLSLVGSTVSQAAIPVTRYDAYVVEVPQLYAAQGGYWGFLLGGNFPTPSNTHPRIINDPNNVLINGQELPGMTIAYKGGEFAGLTAGYRIYGFRFEAELDYRHNKWSKLKRAFVRTNETIDGPIFLELPAILKQGDTVLGSIMGNIIYDFYYTSGWMWSIGFGLGYSVAYFDGNIKDVPDPFGQLHTFDISGTKGAFAGQFILGAAYRWNPCIETGLTYRLFARQGGTYNSRGTFIDTYIVEFGPKYIAHTINFELRFT